MFDMALYETKFKKLKINDAFLCQNISDKPYILINDESLYNNENDYIVINGKYVGGTLVAFPTDIVFTWFTEKSLWDDLSLDLLRFFHSNNIPVDVGLEGNDIIVFGKKLLGITSKKINEGYYEGLFFSFDSDINVIKSVCVKEMKKEPIGLSGFNMDPETIVEFCRQIIKKYNLKEA